VRAENLEKEKEKGTMYLAERTLRKAGLGEEIDNGSITFITGTQVEIVVDENGDLDPEATGRLTDKVAALLHWGGYKAGWGGWTLDKSYHGDFATMLDQLGVGAYH
jgi:hypothetical protein